ncbi:MAG: DNA mismatch repair endonuclease MutH [Gammaproteobacteria bacterium]
MSSVIPASPPLSEADLLANAEGIAGLTLGDLAAKLDLNVPASLQAAKGWVGQLIEHCLGATAASLPEPDFQHIGVELKTLPINRLGQPQESTYVCTVPLLDNTGLKWETSWVRRKLQRVLWVPVEADATLPVAVRRIGMALLWTPSPQQEAVLKQDWEELMELIVTGKLAQISAHHGTWLQIRPKAANARALCTTFDEQGAPTETLPRGFYLRPSFTRTLLAQHYQR